MPPKSKRRVIEEDSDDGILDDKEESEKPKHKKTKIDKPAKRSSESEVPGGGDIDDEGAVFWELSKNRRATISEFRGKRMVNLREYYSKDDKMLPGKKGISLPIDQFSALISILPHIETVLKEKGEQLPRPEYGEDVDSKGDTKRSAKVKKKKNFEATSDEEEAHDGVAEGEDEE